MTFRGHVRNGVIVPDEPTTLPEGASVTFQVEVESYDIGVEGEATSVSVSCRDDAQRAGRANQVVLNAIAAVEKIQAGMRPKEKQDTLEFLREARSGEMYGNGHDD